MSYAIWRSLSQVGQVARGCVQEGGSGMIGMKVYVYSPLPTYVSCFPVSHASEY